MANFCVKCGAAVTPETKFCASCGAHIAISQGNHQSPPVMSPFETTRHQTETLSAQSVDMLSADNLQRMFLSREGRLNRKPYFWCIFVLGCIEVVVGMIAGQNVQTLLGLVFIYPEYCLYIRRLHDIGSDERLAILAAAGSAIVLLGRDTLPDNSPEFALMIIVAYFSILLYMLFKEGTRGPNQYGADPLEWNH